MTKTTTSTSNVPQNSAKTNNNSDKKSAKSPQKNKNSVSGSNSSSGVLNSKHLHNHSTPKIKPKTKRADPDQHSNCPPCDTNANIADGSNSESNLLMKKLFEAVQKQKAAETGTGKPRSRKNTAPPIVPRPMNSSETYAGAAFDRAPAATSFPIPSFIKTPTSSESGRVTNLSTSCPLPSTFEPKKMPSPSSPSLKALSISELFKTDQQQPQNQQQAAEQNKLQSLTNDLRKILNLH